MVSMAFGRPLEAGLMAELALRAPDGRSLTLTVEWQEERGGWTGFVVRNGGREIAGRGRLGPDGSGVLAMGQREIPFYALRERDEIQLWVQGEVYHFSTAEAAAATNRGPGALPASGDVVAPMPG